MCRDLSQLELCSTALTKPARFRPQAIRLKYDNLAFQDTTQWCLGPFLERSVCSVPHLMSSSRSVSPVTRPIITSSLPPHRGRTRLTPAFISLLVSALFFRSRDVYIDGAGSARLLNMTATRRSPSTLRCAPHVLRRKAVPLRRLPVPISQSQQFSSPPGETYAPFSPPCSRGSWP